MVGGVYFFAGKEEFLKNEEIKKIKKSLGSQPIDFDVYYAGEGDFKVIADSLRTPPFFSSKRLVLIKDIHELEGSQIKSLIELIKNPMASIAVVFETHSSAPNKALSEAASRLGVFKQFKPLYGQDLNRWIVNRLKSYDKTIDTAALEALKDNLGSDLTLISSTLDKIDAFTKGKRHISKDDVVELTGKSSVETTYDLVDAIGRKDTPRALGILNEFTDINKDPAEIIGLILWHIKRLKRAVSLLRSNPNRETLRQQLGIPAFAFAKFMAQANEFKTADFKKYFKILLEADTDIKTGRLSKKNALEILVVNLTRLRAA